MSTLKKRFFSFPCLFFVAEKDAALYILLDFYKAFTGTALKWPSLIPCVRIDAVQSRFLFFVSIFADGFAN